MVHQAVEIGLAVARLHGDRHRRLPAGGDAAARCRPSRASRRACRSRRAAPSPAGRRGASSCRRSSGRRRQRDVVVGVLGREQRRAPCRRCRCGRGGGSTDRGLSRCRRRRSRASRFFSSTRSSCGDVAVAGRDLAASASRSRDRTGRGGPSCRAPRTRSPRSTPGSTRQFTAPFPDSKSVGDVLRQHVAHRAGRRVGDAQRLVLVVARGGDEREVRRVGIHCTSAQSAPRQVMSSQSVERCWSGGICRRTTFGAVDVDDHALDHRDDAVAGQRILPRLAAPGGRPSVVTRYISPTPRWSCWKVAIFFESGDQRRIGPVALRPAGVVGGVAEVLHAVAS